METIHFSLLNSLQRKKKGKKQEKKLRLNHGDTLIFIYQLRNLFRIYKYLYLQIDKYLRHK